LFPLGNSLLLLSFNPSATNDRYPALAFLIVPENRESTQSVVSHGRVMVPKQEWCPLHDHVEG
jgi:hypothetical protein